MRNRKIVWTSAIAAAGIAVATGVGISWAENGQGSQKPSDDSDYEVAPLDDGYGSTTDVSASGEYIAGDTYSEDHAEAPRTPTLWHNGEAEDLSSAVKEAVPDAKGEGTVQVVNSEGVAAGSSSYDGFDGFRYQDGKAEQLTVPDLDGQEIMGGQVLSINEDGALLGEMETEKDNYTVAWQPDSSEGTVVDTPDQFTPGEVADDGTIIGGTVKDEHYQVLAKSQDEDDWRDLGLEDQEPIDVTGDWLLAGDYRVNLAEGGKPEKHELTADDGATQVNAIDGQGAVYGSDGDEHPVSGMDGETTDMPYDKDSDSAPIPQAVNANGSVVAGQTSSGEEEDETSNPYVWNAK